MPPVRTLMFTIAVVALGRAAAEPTIVTRTLSGAYQPEPTHVSVITPDSLDGARRYPVLYILPVEAGVDTRYGSGIEEARRADIANRYDVICVAPTFTAMPWYANHPTDPALQQESHFIETVLPWVEAHYPADPTREGRLLLGFSKSGYGALMLLLRHPDTFQKAVAWDAPLDKTLPDQFNMIEVFGSDEYFKRYAIPTLLTEHGEALKGQPARLFLMAMREGGHRMEKVRHQLVASGIPHVFERTATIEHRWGSGWFPRAAALVLGGKPTPVP